MFYLGLLLYYIHVLFFLTKTHVTNIPILNELRKYLKNLLFVSLLDEFGQDCIVYETVSEDKQFYITYKGASVSFYCDYFSFRTELSWSKDASSYKICVKPMFFEDPNCSVRLKYKASSGGNTLHVSSAKPEN